MAVLPLSVLVPYTISCPLRAALDAVTYRAFATLYPVIVRLAVAVWLPRLSPTPVIPEPSPMNFTAFK